MRQRVKQPVDPLVKILEAGGLKPTRQRLDIARVLFARHQHLSADQILAMVNKEGGELSKATVYNTLKVFVARRMIREVIVDPERVFYDSNTSAHHHLYDTQSGEITDVSADGVRVLGLPELPDGMIREAVDVVVRIRPR